MRGKLGYILKITKKCYVAPQVRNLKRKSKNHYISTIIPPLGTLCASKEAVWSTFSPYGVGPLFSSQNWINSETIPKRSKFLMDFDDFCKFFQCYFILAEKQQIKQINYSSLSLFTSLDTQDTLQGGIVVEWKKFLQEIPLWTCFGAICNIHRTPNLCPDKTSQKGIKCTKAKQ